MATRVLITGSTGFVGSHVLKMLAGRNIEIVAAVRKVPSGKDPTVDYKLFDLRSWPKGLDLFTFFGRPDFCIHLAWEGLPDYKANFHLEENLPAHVEMLENLIANGLQRLTVTGTCLEYGLQDGELTEEMECFPVVAYAKAKLKLLTTLDELSKRHNTELKWLRLFYMYGTGQNANSLIPQLDAV